MSARVSFPGLEDLRAALRNLPTALAGEAGAMVTGAAEGAKNDIAAAYPRRSGNLRDSMKTRTKNIGPAGVSVLLINTAKDARWFENGTQTRQTRLGANRGAMPAGNVFYPRYFRARRRMWTDLAELLRREGLIVSGTP